VVRNAFRVASGRRGFTLIEVLLALGLTILVLAAVTSSMMTYGRLTTLGKAESERTRLAQAVLRKMERDIRSVCFRPPRLDRGATAGEAAAGQQAATQTPTQGGSGTATQQMPTNTGGTATAADPASAASGSPIGMFGDSTTLVLHVSRPSRDLNYVPLTTTLSPGGRTSDLLSVTWFLAVANAGGVQGAAGNLASGGSILASRESGAQGLGRIEADRLAMELADAAGDTAGMADAAEIVAPEVNQLEFRYFDGVAWQTEWDSSVYGGLPRAVEILVGFRDADEKKSASTEMLSRLGVEESSQVYRLVVALPLAAPEMSY
jgi:Tfp pilus assembly protein PilX